MSTALLLAYAAASPVCIATPGADGPGTLSAAIARGPRAGTTYATGGALGCLTHTLWATNGIAAPVAASETLFAAIKPVGVMFLGLALRLALALSGVEVGRAHAVAQRAHAVEPVCHE